MAYLRSWSADEGVGFGVFGGNMDGWTFRCPGLDLPASEAVRCGGADKRVDRIASGDGTGVGEM